MRRLLALAVFGGLVVVFPVLPAYAALADADGDLIPDELDLCPAIADPFQGDVDGDGVGDLCDSATTGVTTFEGTPLRDLVFGTDAADTLSGAESADALYGEGGDDTLDGGDGRDFLSGGPGTDTLTGGGSCDVFAFDPNGDGDVITDFNPEVDRLRFPAQDEDPSDDAPPQATFGGDDFLVVTFLADNEVTGTLEFHGLEPGLEIDLITAPCEPLPKELPVFIPGALIDPPPFVCSPLFPGESDELFDTDFPLDGVLINGTAENETIFGTQCSDFLSGDGGFELIPETDEPQIELPPSCATDVCSDDVIYGLAGNDIIFGDTLMLDSNDVGGNDLLFGGDGDDLVVGDVVEIEGCECEEGGSGPVGGDDIIFGDNGDDVLIGDALFSVLGNATGGDDIIEGGNGDDVLIGDAIYGIGYGAQGGDDVLIGGAGDDVIIGDATFYVDSFSAAGEDVLIGGAGDDILTGDAAYVDGLAATDTFVYDTSSNFGDDVITDLGQREVYDIIQFSGPGLTDVADLDARSTFGDDGFDLLAIVYTDVNKITEVGSVLIWNAGGAGIASWADLEAMWPVDVVVVP